MKTDSESLSLIQLESMIRYAKSRPSYEYAKPIEDFLYWQFRNKGTPELFAQIDSIAQHFKQRNAEQEAEKIVQMVMRRMKPQVDLRKIKVTNSQITKAIEEVISLFAVGTQWVGIYRILVDFCGFPAEITAFCEQIEQLCLSDDISYKCTYQSVQKPMGGILARAYTDWLNYHPSSDRTVFERQKKVADRMYQLLKEAERKNENCIMETTICSDYL